jgi:hypothetical protein
MFHVPGMPANPGQIAWENIPRLRSERISVIKAREGVTGFNHHPCLVHFDGRFFAGWNTGERDEDAIGQRVQFATSENGLKWSEPVDLTERPERFRYTAGGFWIRDGELLALASRRSGRDGPDTGDDNPLLGFRWKAKEKKFGPPFVIAKNFFPNNVPQLTPDREWLMLGKSAARSARGMMMAKGGVSPVDIWTMGPLPDAQGGMEEAEWYTLPDRSLVAQFRGGRDLHRVIRLHSTDDGKTWSKPIVTDFPEAASRHHTIRLRDGTYALFINPHVSAYRVPLTVAFSHDGIAYDHFANLRMEQTNRRYSGHAKAPGYQYVRAIEHERHIWAIYSVNKEDIEISRFPIDEVDRIRALRADDYRAGQTPRPEIIVDNSDRGFSTDSPWLTASKATGHHGSDYAYVENPATDLFRWARWSVDVPRSGRYHVYLRWSTLGFSTRSPMVDRVPVEVKHLNGIDQRSVDQTRYGGTWIHLGTYVFNVGEEATVTIRAQGIGITVADAVKFVRAGDE